jgi:hypothetical protein
MLGLAQLSLLMVPALVAPQDGPIAPGVPSSCAVTLAAERPFARPSLSSASRFWYGSEGLAVLLKTGGKWRGMGPTRSYRDKLFWWRQGYDGSREPTPKLVVRGRRLDGEAPFLMTTCTTGANHADFGGWAMLVALEFPAAGCWEITGEYGPQKVTFIVEVGE